MDKTAKRGITGAILGGGGTILVKGLTGVGIASGGFAVGVPLFVITAGIGAITLPVVLSGKDKLKQKN